MAREAVGMWFRRWPPGIVSWAVAIMVTWVIIACGAGPVSAGSGEPLDRPRTFLTFGVGASSVTNPSPRRFEAVVARPGLRAGMMRFLSERPRTFTIDTGVLADVRRVATYAPWWSDRVGSVLSIEQEITLYYITVPFRARLSPINPGHAPYFVIGPELTVLVKAQSEGATTKWGRRTTATYAWTGRADRLSASGYAGAGLVRSFGGREMFVELAMTLGLEPVHGESTYSQDPPFGLWNSRNRMLLLSVGIRG